jgi:UDPglucose 6-dehydrogenase
MPVGTGDEVERILAETRPDPTWRWCSIRNFCAKGAAIASNAFLATKIEIADLCKKVGGDVQQVARGIGLDNRIGGKFLHAGPGFGGSCFPKDKVALIKTAQGAEAPLRITLRSESMSATRAQEICSVAGALAPLVDDVCAG